MTRPINKEYCFIDFHATIDAIKYRVYYLTEKVKELYKPTQDRKDYYCPRCKAQWTQLEVLDKVGPMGFECHRCGGILEREEQEAGDSAGHEKQSRLMSQLDPLIKLLQKIDAQDIPVNDFEKALAMQVVVQRDRSNITKPIALTNQSKTLANSTGNPVSAPLDVSVISSNETTDAEKVEEAKRKADVVAQNALPVWHTTSTVTGERTTSQKEGEPQTNGTSLAKEEKDEKREAGALDDELTAYYTQLAQEKEKEARKEREEDASSGEEEDEFEDVDVGGSNAGTPISTPAVSFNANEETKGRDSGSSGPATENPSPAPNEDDREGLVNKRVKFHSQGEIQPNGALDKPSTDVSDEDDVEFEDV